MPLAGAANLAVVLDGDASQSSAYDEPRALTLFGMLEANREPLKVNEPPEKPTDITGRDGVVYRFFPAAASSSTAGQLRSAQRTRVEGPRGRREAPGHCPRRRRGPDGKALVWKYDFPFGGPTRWTSGFAQAVAADALSRTNALVHDPKLGDAAKAAFLAIPNGLSLQIGGGSWVREYGFSDIVT